MSSFTRLTIILLLAFGAVVGALLAGAWLDWFVRRKPWKKRVSSIKDGAPTEDLLRSVSGDFGKQELPELLPPVFDRRARRLADLIIIRAPSTVIATDLWLTLVAHRGGRRKAIWYGIAEGWAHYVTIPVQGRWYLLLNLCIACGHRRRRHWRFWHGGEPGSDIHQPPACYRCGCAQFEGVRL